MDEHDNIGLGFSRDGFHFTRSTPAEGLQYREPFIAEACPSWTAARRFLSANLDQDMIPIQGQSESRIASPTSSAAPWLAPPVNIHARALDDAPCSPRLRTSRVLCERSWSSCGGPITAAKARAAPLKRERRH